MQGFPLKEVKVETVEEKKLGICGLPVGFYMETQGVLIVDTGEIINQDGNRIVRRSEFIVRNRRKNI